VLEKLRSGEHKVNNLNIIDEAHSRLLEVGGIKLRLLGLGGAVVMHKLFDNGEGRTTIAGGQGTMWTTLLQMGELVDTANRVYDPTETRVFVTHASPAREGLLNQLSVTLKADFSISAGLHFRYGSSYNEFSVNPSLDHYRGKLAASKASFNDVWETVKNEVEPAVAENESQQRLLKYATEVVEKMPTIASGGNPFGGQAGAANGGQVDESAFKNMWNFNLADAAFGWLVLDIEGGRIGTEMRAQGFNFAHRSGKNAVAPKPQGVASTSSPAPTPGGNVPPASQAMPPQAQRGPVPVQNQGQPRGPPPQGATPAMNQPQSTPQRQSGPTQVRPGGPSPAPVASQGAAKPATPQPTLNNGAASQATPTSTGEGKLNGAAENQRPAPVTTPSGAEAERKPTSAIFLGGISNPEEAKLVFAEADRAKIQRVDQSNNNTVVHFSSPEEMKTVLEKGADKGGKYPKQTLREYMDHRSFSSRGGRFAGRGGGRGGNEGGYRSGGAATGSDSEGARGGRGGMRGRGRGGGERGRGRGRGGAGNKDGAAAGGDGDKPSASDAQW
jgi:hypothetical protein